MSHSKAPDAFENLPKWDWLSEDNAVTQIAKFSNGIAPALYLVGEKATRSEVERRQRQDAAGAGTIGKAEGDTELARHVLSELLLCPICLHPIPYSKKFQCRRCGFMPG